MSFSRAGKWGPLILAGVLACAIAPLPSRGQVIPPAAVAQLQQVVGNRVEAVTALGGDYGAGSGLYSLRGGRVADISVTKFGGSGDVAPARPLYLGNLQWAPVLAGNLGYISSENDFNSGFLQGNKLRFDTFAVQAGLGASIYFNEHFRLIPTISGIYGHTENEFIAQNAVGNALKAAGSGTYVDWVIDTWTVQPGLEAVYSWTWRRANFALSSRFNYFHTESFNSSSPVIQISGDSETWENKFSADVPLGVSIFGRELRTGGFFSRSELGGGIANGLNTDHVYKVNGRLVLDLSGFIWKMRWLGIGATYFFADNLNGWSAGVDLKFQF